MDPQQVLKERIGSNRAVQALEALAEAGYVVNQRFPNDFTGHHFAVSWHMLDVTPSNSVYGTHHRRMRIYVGNSVIERTIEVADQLVEYGHDAERHINRQLSLDCLHELGSIMELPGFESTPETRQEPALVDRVREKANNILWSPGSYETFQQRVRRAQRAIENQGPGVTHLPPTAGPYADLLNRT